MKTQDNNTIKYSKEKALEETYLAHFFDKFYNLIPNSKEKSSLGSEILIRAFKPVMKDLIRISEQSFVMRLKEDLIHPEFCKYRGEQFKECTLCYINKISSTPNPKNKII